MKKKHHHIIHKFLGLGTMSWIAIMVFFNLSYKAIQVFHLSKINWDFTSFNIVGLFIALMGSLSYLVFSYLTKSNKWHKGLGYIGVLFAGFILFMFIFQKLKLVVV